jgi:hypothetical protein
MFTGEYEVFWCGSGVPKTVHCRSGAFPGMDHPPTCKVLLRLSLGIFALKDSRTRVEYRHRCVLRPAHGAAGESKALFT